MPDHSTQERNNQQEKDTRAELLAALKRMIGLMDNLWEAVPWGKTHNLNIAELNEAPIQAKRAIERAEAELAEGRS